jgi:purine-nucleoside phosphorylase
MTLLTMLKRIKESTSYINSLTDISPVTGIILGTGLGNFINNINIKNTLYYKDIPNFPETTVENHKGVMVFGSLGNAPVIAMQGRYHFYEGLKMKKVIFPVRVLKFLGIKYLIITNAAGGINPDFKAGDIMIINDHINLMPNPLAGKHWPEFGDRFPDMSEAYDRRLINLAGKIAREHNITLKEGCYVAVTGPTLETPKEYQFYRTAGGDAVGMSTVPEVIAAHQMGIRCLAISVITNMGITDKVQKPDHAGILNEAEKALPKLSVILKNTICSIREIKK